MAAPLRSKAKPGLPRLGREAERPPVEEGGESWAVSYADFLMVLLSFFILFFSTDAPKKQTIIQQVVASVGAKGSGGLPAKGASDVAPAGPVAAPGDASAGASRAFRSLATLRTSLGDLANLDVEPAKQGLVVHLPEDIYDLGRLDPRRDQAKALGELLERLGAFRDRIGITVVGHSDRAPVAAKGGRLAIRDNFDLSSLRATRFLQLMVKRGFAPERLAAKGTAEFGRNSRTLSLVLEPVEVEVP